MSINWAAKSWIPFHEIPGWPAVAYLVWHTAVGFSRDTYLFYESAQVINYWRK